MLRLIQLSQISTAFLEKECDFDQKILEKAIKDRGKYSFVENNYYFGRAI